MSDSQKSDVKWNMSRNEAAKLAKSVAALKKQYECERELLNKFICCELQNGCKVKHLVEILEWEEWEIRYVFHKRGIRLGPGGPSVKFDWDKACELYLNGMSIADIAQTLNCSKQSVYRKIHENNWSRS